MQQTLLGKTRYKCKKSHHHHHQHQKCLDIVLMLLKHTHTHTYTVKERSAEWDSFNSKPFKICMSVSTYFINLLYVKGRANWVMLIHAIGHAILEIYMLCLTNSFRFF